MVKLSVWISGTFYLYITRFFSVDFEAVGVYTKNIYDKEGW